MRLKLSRRLYYFPHFKHMTKFGEQNFGHDDFHFVMVRSLVVDFDISDSAFFLQPPDYSMNIFN